MATDRKYFYMRLKEDFFESEAMILLESLPDGLIYQNILLKMYCRSLKNEGRLMFNNVIPYNADMIAKITRHQIGTVEKALQIFQQMGLIDILDNGAIYMMDIQQFIGKSSTEADRQREYQRKIAEEKQKISCKKSNEICKKSYKKSTPYIEIDTDLNLNTEIELNKEQDDETENVKLSAIVDKFNSICISMPKVQKLTESRRKVIKARLKDDGYDQIIEAFKMAEESDFLSGRSGKWQATFDWIMKPSNFVKIIEGNYTSKEKKHETKLLISVTGAKVDPDEGYYLDEEGYAHDKFGNVVY